MNTILKDLWAPVLTALVPVLPLVILELINRPVPQTSFPFVLFGLLWVVAVAFVTVLRLLRQKIRSGGQALSKIYLAGRLLLLIALAGFWTALVIDQFPCFLGLPNCD